MSFMNSVASMDRAAEATAKFQAELESFARRMRTVPSKAVKDDLYGTTVIVVDTAHALNIFCKVFPGRTINKDTAIRALHILQDRLDERYATRR